MLLLPISVCMPEGCICPTSFGRGLLALQHDAVDDERPKMFFLWRIATAAHDRHNKKGAFQEKRAFFVVIGRTVTCRNAGDIITRRQSASSRLQRARR